jgi:hypothetical protein
VNRNEFADAPRRRCASIGRRFDSRDIASHNRRDESRADFFVPDKLHIRGFDHRVSRFDHCDQTFTLNHSQCFLHLSFLLKFLFVIAKRK